MVVKAMVVRAMVARATVKVMVVKAMVVKVMAVKATKDMSTTSITTTMRDPSMCRKWSTSSLECRISEWVCATPTTCKEGTVRATALATGAKARMGREATSRMESEKRWSGSRRSCSTRGGGRTKRKQPRRPPRPTPCTRSTRGRSRRRSWSASSLSAKNTATSTTSSVCSSATARLLARPADCSSAIRGFLLYSVPNIPGRVH